jgi:hypothetical protein
MAAQIVVLCGKKLNHMWGVHIIIIIIIIIINIKDWTL